MKIAVFSDAHGNALYVENCLDTLASLDVAKTYCLGDYFGYGAEGAAVLHMFRGIQAHCLMGNHEAMLLGLLPLDPCKEKAYNLEEQKKYLHADDLNFLGALEPSHYAVLETKRVLFVHGTPAEPLTGYFYPDNDITSLGNLPYDIVFMGHTHRPFIKQTRRTLYVNVGSCGLPRDIGNRPSFCVYDTSDGTCEIVRPEIDVESIKTYSEPLPAAVRQCMLRNVEGSV